MFEPVDTCLLRSEILHAALTSAPSLSAGGPSGLVYEHYRDILGDAPGAFAIFHSVCCLIARGLVPTRARAALSSSRLLAMAKRVAGGPDEIRPLAVGEVLHRLVARVVGLQYRERCSEFFSPLQFGVATPGGWVVAGLDVPFLGDPRLERSISEVRYRIKTVNLTLSFSLNR
jgi:hypothetical protein